MQGLVGHSHHQEAGAPKPAPGFLGDPGVRRFLLLAVLFTLLRLPLLGLVPVSGDEAYYWQCARHPDWSYYDQPPLMIGLIGLSTRAFGINETAVRLPALLLGFAMALGLSWIGWRLFQDRRGAWWSFVGLMATPIFALGTLYSSTDVLLCFFVLVVPALAAVAILENRPRWWLAVGFLAGLAGLAKFSAVLMLPGIVALALLSPNGRRQLRGVEPYLGALLGLVAVSPALIWAAQHHADNLMFQLVTRHTSAPFTWRWLGEYAGSQFLLESPLLFPLLLAGLFVETRRAFQERDLATLALALPADVFLGFFALVALRADSAPHWAAPAVIVGSLPTARWVLRRWSVWGRTLRGLVVLSLVLGWTLAGAAHGLLFFYDRIPPGLNYSSRVGTDVIANVFGWPELVAHLRSLEGAAFDPRRDPIICDSYTAASLIAFYSHGRYDPLLMATAEGKHGLAYLYWQDASRYAGRPGLYVGDYRKRLTRDAFASAYGQVVPLAPFTAAGSGPAPASFSSQTWRIMRGGSLSPTPAKLAPFAPVVARSPGRDETPRPARSPNDA